MCYNWVNNAKWRGGEFMIAIKLLFFVGMYIFMASLVCFEVSPRVKDCDVLLSGKLNRIGLILLGAAIVALGTMCYLFGF